MEIKFEGGFTKEEYFWAVKLSTRKITTKSTFVFDLWKLLLGFGAVLLVIGIRMLFSQNYFLSVILL